jgi:hypothetical protein
MASCRPGCYSWSRTYPGDPNRGRKQSSLEMKSGAVDHLKLEQNIFNQTAWNCGVHSFQNTLGTLCFEKSM